MCGIVGFLGFCSDTEATLSHMIAAIRHRGPDAQNQWIEQSEQVAFGHARLAVVDLSDAGSQPMHSHSGRYVISYNGEIYNHLDVRRELETYDVRPNWRGTSDSETLAAGFDAWGVEQTLKKCIGMFAIAIWDSQEKVLTLVRDRFGEKPLYYQPTANGVIFGSEISALEKHPSCNRRVSQAAVRELSQSSCIPAPRSIYRNVYKLLPGTLINFNSSGYAGTAQWWSPIDTAVQNSGGWNGTHSEALVELEDKLTQSVQRQMMADVPLGAFLSGGIDSSLVTALMQKNRTKGVKTFSIGFENEQFNEAEYASKVAAHLGTDHTEYYVSDQDVCQLVPDISSLYSEPLADSSQLPTYLVSKLTKNEVTVALTGDAGDEIFAGYNRHTFAFNSWQTIKKIPISLRRVGVGMIGRMDESSLDKLFSRFPVTSEWTRVGEKIKRAGHVLAADNIQQLHQYSARGQDLLHVLDADAIESEELGPQAELLDAIDKNMENSLQHLDEMRWLMVRDQIDFLPNDVLAKVDRASMACALETRAPFLDHTLVEFAQTLPSNMLVSGQQGKLPLRSILSKYVPSELFERPKMGFAVPIHEMLRGPLREWAESQLSEEKLLDAGAFDPAIVRQLWADHIQGVDNNITRLWPVLVFQSWIANRRA